jgi:hypothetical protein
VIFCVCMSDILRLYDLLVLYPVIGSVPKILRQDQEMKLVHHQMWLCTQSMAAWYLNESKKDTNNSHRASYVTVFINAKVYHFSSRLLLILYNGAGVQF